MSSPKAAIGLSAGAIMALVLANGPELVDFLSKLVDLLSGIAAKSTVGWWAVPTGLVMGWLMMWFLRAKIPDSRIRWVMHARMIAIELLPLVATFLVVTILLDTTLGAILGMAAAILVSLTYRVVAGIASAIGRRITVGS